MTELSLAKRKRLPDALRVLLADYPRAGWENDPGFEGLVRFWLDRHLMFRRLMGEMRSGTEALIDKKIDGPRFAALLSRHGGMFVNGLHEHHMIEDSHYFPKLAKLDKRISRGFDILDKDHHAIDELLSHFVGGANGVLQAHDNRDKLSRLTGDFHAELLSVERLLDRHLQDEEELIVPVILRYGAAGLQ